MTMLRLLSWISIWCFLIGCATTPRPFRIERFAVQWETDIAASGFWTADGQVLDQGEVPQTMIDFQGKQPTHLHDPANRIAYYEVEGYVVPLQYSHDIDAVAHRVLHITSVRRMEPAHSDLPPLAKLHPQLPVRSGG